MNKLTTLLCIVFIASGSCAADFDNTLLQGRITVKARAAQADPDKLDTASIGLRRIDTGEQLFCMNAKPDEFVGGPTTVVNKRSGEILLQSFAFSEAGCTGLMSEGSADRYRVVFGKPNKPLLIELVTES